MKGEGDGEGAVMPRNCPKRAVVALNVGRGGAAEDCVKHRGVKRRNE